jgi:hypothetical protein
MNLSEHFTLDEMTFSEIALRNGLSNAPDQFVTNNLIRLAKLLEKVRALLNRPIHINSAYRSLNVNKLVGGQPNSQHCLGCAADIKVGGMTPDLVMKAIIHSDIQYDQIIREFDSWVHISIPNGEGYVARKNALIIDKQGTRAYA